MRPLNSYFLYSLFGAMAITALAIPFFGHNKEVPQESCYSIELDYSVNTIRRIKEYPIALSGGFRLDAYRGGLYAFGFSGEAYEVHDSPNSLALAHTLRIVTGIVGASALRFRGGKKRLGENYDECLQHVEMELGVLAPASGLVSRISRFEATVSGLTPREDADPLCNRPVERNMHGNGKMCVVTPPSDGESHTEFEKNAILLELSQQSESVRRAVGD